MDEQHDMTDAQCDALVQALFNKVAARAGCDVESLSADLRKHHELRRGLVRVAYELGRMVERSKTPNDSAHRTQLPYISIALFCSGAAVLLCCRFFASVYRH